MIELILMQRVDKLGQMGELVKVRPGYARKPRLFRAARAQPHHPQNGEQGQRHSQKHQHSD